MYGWFVATIFLHVTYPPEYPDVAPNLSLTSPPPFHADGNSSFNINNNKSTYLSLPADTNTLLAALEETVAENAGMAMIFAVVSTLKERAERIVSERQAAEQAVRDKAAQRREEEENRRFVGEKVTRESFLRWRERFRREMREEEEERRKREEGGERRDGEGGKGMGVGIGLRSAGSGSSGSRKEEKKLTGRELWERGLVGKVEVDDDDDDDNDDREIKRDGVGRDGIEEMGQLRIAKE